MELQCPQAPQDRIVRRCIPRTHSDALQADTGIILPQATPENASIYWAAAQSAEIDGRCIAIGQAEMGPQPYYHWRIEGDGGSAKVVDFWADHIVTTADTKGR